jgi:hypothetical protein
MTVGGVQDLQRRHVCRRGHIPDGQAVRDSLRDGSLQLGGGMFVFEVRGLNLSRRPLQLL